MCLRRRQPVHATAGGRTRRAERRRLRGKAFVRRARANVCWRSRGGGGGGFTMLGHEFESESERDVSEWSSERRWCLSFAPTCALRAPGRSAAAGRRTAQQCIDGLGKQTIAACVRWSAECSAAHSGRTALVCGKHN